MDSENRFLKFLGLMVVVVVVAILKIQLRSSQDCSGQLIVLMFALGLLVAVKMFTAGSSSGGGGETTTRNSPPPVITPFTVFFNGQKYIGMQSMPIGTRNSFLESLERSAKLFPETFAQRLTDLNRRDLAAEYQEALNLHQAGRLTREELETKVRKTLEKFEAGRFYELPARLPAPAPQPETPLLMEMNYNGKKYTSLESMPPHVRKAYAEMLDSSSKNFPEMFENILEKIGRHELATELKESRKLLELGLITENELEATREQILRALR